MKIYILMIVWISFMTNVIATEAIDSLRLYAHKEFSESITNQLGVIRVSFVNVSSNDVRLLRTFSKQYNQRVWFSMEVVGEDGTPALPVAAGGKVSIRGAMEYIVLHPNESFGFVLDYRGLVPSLSPGRYRVKVTYSNQYGRDCFRGKVSTEPFEVKVPK